MASTQTIIINSDGSIKQRVLGEYINQGNDLVDTIYIGFVDDTIASSYVGTANFELPNGDTNTLVGTYVSGITLPNDTTNYKGYKIVLTQAQTIYNGQLKMSFVVTNGEEILYSYKTTFTINASVVAADEEKITLAQWNSLVSNLATYQVAYNEYNVRGYSSQEKANNDYGNLDTDQISIFSDGSNLYYFKGGEDELSATKIANYDDISLVSNALPITGGTMQGDIDMNAKSLTNVNKVNFAPSIDVGSIAELKSEVNGENIYLRLYSKNVNATALACEMSWLTDGGINFYKSISANKGVTNLPTPKNDSDAVNKEYVDDNVNGLNESINNLREVAEGKTKSIVFSYADVTISSSYFGTYRKFYKPNGTEITSWEEFCAYIGKNATTTSYTSNNSIFNSQDNYIDVSITDAKWFAFTSIGSSNYTIYALNSNNYDDFFSALKTGDILLITETDVPDRWFDKYATSPIRFWKMETSKVDITKYVLKSGDTMSGALKINEIDNTSGNALVRFKSTESKNVFGGSNFNCLLMGSGDRPYYSKDGSDFSGNELALKSDVDAKQDTLVSGTNIKTINNQSLLGSGNISISGGSGDTTTYYSHTIRFVGTLNSMNCNFTIYAISTSNTQITSVAQLISSYQAKTLSAIGWGNLDGSSSCIVYSIVVGTSAALSYVQGYYITTGATTQARLAAINFSSIVDTINEIS